MQSAENRCIEVTVCLGEGRLLFWFLNGFGGIGVLYFFCLISFNTHMRSERLLSELLPRLSLPSSLSPACTLRLNIFLKFSPQADLGLFSVQILIHSNTQNFSQTHKQPLPFGTSNVFFNQCH